MIVKVLLKLWRLLRQKSDALDDMAVSLSKLDDEYLWSPESVSTHVSYYAATLKLALLDLYSVLSEEIDPTEADLQIIASMLRQIESREALRDVAECSDVATSLYACMTVAWFYYVIDAYSIGLSMLAQRLGVDESVFASSCFTLAVELADDMLEHFST